MNLILERIVKTIAETFRVKVYESRKLRKLSTFTMEKADIFIPGIIVRSK